MREKKIGVVRRQVDESFDIRKEYVHAEELLWGMIPIWKSVGPQWRQSFIVLSSMLAIYSYLKRAVHVNFTCIGLVCHQMRFDTVYYCCGWGLNLFESFFQWGKRETYIRNLV